MDRSIVEERLSRHKGRIVNWFIDIWRFVGVVVVVIFGCRVGAAAGSARPNSSKALGKEDTEGVGVDPEAVRSSNGSSKGVEPLDDMILIMFLVMILKRGAKG